MMGERLGRLYHRGRARWTDVRVHESLRFDGPTETFARPFIHLNNPTLVHKHLKTLRYAELKARDWLDRGKPAQMWMTPFVHLSAFLKDYRVAPRIPRRLARLRRLAGRGVICCLQAHALLRDEAQSGIARHGGRTAARLRTRSMMNPR